MPDHPYWFLKMHVPADFTQTKPTAPQTLPPSLPESTADSDHIVSEDASRPLVGLMFRVFHHPLIRTTGMTYHLSSRTPFPLYDFRFDFACFVCAHGIALRIKNCSHAVLLRVGFDCPSTCSSTVHRASEGPPVHLFGRPQTDTDRYCTVCTCTIAASFL